MNAMNILNHEKSEYNSISSSASKESIVDRWVEGSVQWKIKGMSDFTTLEKTWVKFVYISFEAMRLPQTWHSYSTIHHHYNYAF